VLVDNYPDLIIRSCVIDEQKSSFKCIEPELVKNKYFLEQLQNNRGRFIAPIYAAKQELTFLHKMTNILNENN